MTLKLCLLCGVQLHSTNNGVYCTPCTLTKHLNASGRKYEYVQHRKNTKEEQREIACLNLCLELDELEPAIPEFRTMQEAEAHNRKETNER